MGLVGYALCEALSTFLLWAWRARPSKIGWAPFLIRIPSTQNPRTVPRHHPAPPFLYLDPISHSSPSPSPPSPPEQLPLWSLVALGAYALGNIGWNLMHFNSCPEAAEELQKVRAMGRATRHAWEGNVGSVLFCFGGGFDESSRGARRIKKALRPGSACPKSHTLHRVPFPSRHRCLSVNTIQSPHTGHCAGQGGPEEEGAQDGVLSDVVNRS